MKEINELAKEIHADNVQAGWWPEGRCLMEVCQLIITEISEATEGERKDLADDKLPHRKMGEVELADAMIRLLDLGGFLGLINDDDVDTDGRWPDAIGGKHFKLSARIVSVGESIDFNAPKKVVNMNYTMAVGGIQMVAMQMNYDLWGALEEKRKFNKTRADHKLENRAKEGGKKF